MNIPFLDKILNRGERVPDQVFKSRAIGAKDIAAPASIQINQDNIKLGERYVKSFFVFSYPRYLSTGWLSPVINLDTPMDVSMFIHPVDSEEILKKLRKRTAEVQSEIAEREEKGLVRSPELETAYQDLEDLRDKLQTAREKMFQFSLYITVYGEDKQDLDSTETRLRSILESRMIYPKPALFQQKKGFLSSVPYGTDKLSVTNPMNTAPLSSAFPFISFDLSSNEGILYGVNRHNNSLVLFDRFSLENANSVVFGKSGSGKSVKGDEPVLVKEKDGKIKQTQIGKLIDKVIEENNKEQIDHETEGVTNPDLEVFTFNQDLKGEWSPVKVAARKDAPEKFYKFKTKSGREITTTGDHNLVTLKDGKPTVTQSSEAEAGDYIPLPRKVSCKEKSPGSLNLLQLLKNSERIYVKGAEELIKNNYKKLKSAGIPDQSNQYLHFYQNGTAIPIGLFWKILECLEIQPDSQTLENIRITHIKNGEGFKVHFPINKNLLRIAGFATAEGSSWEDTVAISNLNEKVLETISSSLNNLGVKFHKTKKGGRIEGIKTKDRVFVEIVKALTSGEISEASEKRVWPFVFNLGQQEIANYLKSYFEGDGGVDTKNLSIKATSCSKKLVLEIANLLYYFGIIGRISKVEANEKNPENWVLTISGQENLTKFANSINFFSDAKIQKLKQILEREKNSNVDLIPESESIFKEMYNCFPPLFSDMRKFTAWKNGKKKPTPEHLERFVDKVRNKIEDFRNLKHQFKVLSEVPELNAIIKEGKQDEELNSKLWKELGASWRLMKNKEVSPGSKNVLKATKVVNGNDYSLTKLKKRIHSGFKEMQLPASYYDRALEPRYLQKDTQYKTIQKSAQFVWENYQDALQNKIPEIEKKLDQLELLTDSDLFWDPIVEVKEIENKDEKYVYDLEVDNEVFLAGHGGMFVHNSFFQKLEILRSLMMGIDNIVVDPENEYKFLADAVGGSYFNMSLTSPNHVNPFDLPSPRENEKPEDVLRSNIINLVGLLRIMLGGLNAEEDALIDQALTETYRARDITPQTDPSLWEERIPLMEDFESVLETMEGTESLVRRLRKFTSGSYADFFNNPTNVKMDNNLVCFGIRDMEDELRPMAMFMIMRYIWNSIRANLKKRILVVDEAWWMMKNEDGASFLFSTAKRGRKYWLGVTTITQDVIDFMKSDYGKPIITNSSLQLLMKQSPSGAEMVQDAFNLTESEKSMLLEAPVGEGLFFAGPKHVGLRVVASYAEEQIITTSPEEVKKIRESKKELGQQTPKNQSRLEQGEF